MDLLLAFPPLAEPLADEVSDFSATRYLAPGWRSGPQRDDQGKRHPCLESYDLLPDSEKEYGHVAGRGTPKTISEFGCRIEPATTR